MPNRTQKVDFSVTFSYNSHLWHFSVEISTHTNPVWGGKKTDKKGKSLGDFIEAGLIVLNDGSGTCLRNKG